MNCLQVEKVSFGICYNRDRKYNITKLLLINRSNFIVVFQKSRKRDFYISYYFVYIFFKYLGIIQDIKMQKMLTMFFLFQRYKKCSTILYTFLLQIKISKTFCHNFFAIRIKLK